MSVLSVTNLVTPEDLLAAMATETPAVCGKIHRLLLPSYFPNAEEGPALVAYLLRTSPSAGCAFCRSVPGNPGTRPSLC